MMPPDAQDLEMYMLHLLTGAIASALGRARFSLKGRLEDPLKKLVALRRDGSRALSRNFSTTIFVPMRHMMGTHEDVSLAVTLACRGSQESCFVTCIMGSESGRLNMSWTPREQDMLQDAELSTNVFAKSDVCLAWDDVNRRKSEASRRPLQA